MTKLKTDWKIPNEVPDGDHLKKQWDFDVSTLEKSLAHSDEASKRRKSKTQALVKASGMSDDDVSKLLKEDKDRSKKVLAEVESTLIKPAVDIEALHEKDLKQAMENADLIKGPGNPSWSGYIFNPFAGGYWSRWNGEAEEIPNVTIDPAGRRFDPRAQAYGEGWWDSDYSQIHAFLSFRFNPPSWGHLHVYAYPWLHGYYMLYSDDAWYKGEYARAVVDTWADIHQNVWRSRSYQRRFTMSGPELHPTRIGRIDSSYGISYSASVGASDTVTIRIGVNLYCQAQASGGRSILNFQAGSANYIYVPYVYWYLHH